MELKKASAAQKASAMSVSTPFEVKATANPISVVRNDKGQLVVTLECKAAPTVPWKDETDRNPAKYLKQPSIGHTGGWIPCPDLFCEETGMVITGIKLNAQLITGNLDFAENADEVKAWRATQSKK